MPQQPETFEGQQSSETFLKERFVERSLEKILKTLKEPPLMARDYVLMGLMGLMLVVLVLTRLGGSTSSAQLKEITQRLDAISERLDTMEMGGAAPAKKPLAPRPRASTRAEVLAPDRTRPVAATEKLPSGAPSAEPAVQDADSDHVMKPGETLWNVAEQYYADGSLMTALMRYNKIRDARDLAVGATIKVPPVERLRAQAEPSGGGVTVPPPTPH